MTELEEKIIARINGEGPLTFRDFMQTALYDPQLGYYNTERPKIGPAGDYYTSSNVHAAFGAVLALVFADMLSEYDDKVIVEIGAGTGRLACDLLSTMRGERAEVYDRLSYVIAEKSPAMREFQKERLKDFERRVTWRDLAEIERDTRVRLIYSNELIDAFPVHRARFHQGSLEESYVAVRPDTATGEKRLSLVWSEPSTAELSRYVERMKVRLAEGQIIEINLDAIDWLRRVSASLESGYLVTIDYGDTAAHLYGPDRLEGTLRSFYQHSLIDSPLERIGEQDITASVNFTALIEYGRDLGLEALSYERQTAFLMRNGLIERIAAMEKATGAIEDLKERLAIKNLFVPGGVSDNFRVLIQKKA
ncbi:MAG TPA: SAM-dependent methyltransferase [Blastocatellia bacterium]|nr:SAM-dependent methyltransferase [Blastocatellia bacterium]